MTISFTRTINVVSGFSLAMGLLIGSISFTTENKTLKNISRTTAISLGAIAFVNKLTGSYYEQLASNKNQDKLNKLNCDLTVAQEEGKNLREHDNFLTQIREKNENEILTLKQKLESKSHTLTGLNAELTLKTQGLNHINEINEQKIQQLIKDNNLRIKKIYQRLLSKLIELTQVRIDSNYYAIHSLLDKEITRLSTLIQENSDNQDFIDVKNALEKFQSTLSDSENNHDEQVENLRKFLSEINLTDENILKNLDLASEIFDKTSLELANLKVKMRNCLNVATSKNLKSALEELAIEKSNHRVNYKAIGKYRQLTDYSKQTFDELEEKHIIQNNKAIESIDAALAGIEEVRGTNLKLNQRVLELSQPQTWKPATRTDLRMGNVIILHLAKHGYTLDRHSTNYEGWKGTVLFTYDRSKKKVLAKDLNEQFADELQPLCKAYSKPKFEYDPESDLLLCHLQYAPKPEGKKLTPVETVEEFLVESSSLIKFVTESFHVGFWGESGSGKSTAISNTIGGMIQALGGAPTIRTTIPKIDADTAKLFPKGFIDWLGIPDSVFGLLEAALEIQYRMYVNQQKYLAGKDITDFDPIIFFIDEINAIITRWGSVSKNDLAIVLERFQATLEGDRRDYFRDHMRTELENYPHKFARTLLMFIWQTGRSLKVKSLIAGQNLQPGKLGLNKNDLANCSFMTLTRSIKSAIGYTVEKHQTELIEFQHKSILEATKDNPNLRFTGLFAPSRGDSYYSILPPPGTYKWDIGTLNRNQENPESQIVYHNNLESNTVNVDYNNDNLDLYHGTQIGDNSTNLGYQGYIDGTGGTKGTKDGTKPESSHRRTCHNSWYHVPNLPQEYKTLDYTGGMEFFMKLPKKADGTVHKTNAYKTVFKVCNKRNQKPFSEFIDILQKEFGL